MAVMERGGQGGGRSRVGPETGKGESGTQLMSRICGGHAGIGGFGGVWSEWVRCTMDCADRAREMGRSLENADFWWWKRYGSVLGV